MKPTLILWGSLALGSCSQPGQQEAAIKQLLQKEAATWRAGDVPGHAACWHIQPYSRVLVSTPEGKVLDIPPALMVAPSPAMGKGGSVVQTDFKMSIADRNAWVSHQEEATSADGQKTYSYEIRILEKINNEWKLVGQSVQAYKR